MFKDQVLFEGKPMDINGKPFTKSVRTGTIFCTKSLIEQIDALNSTQIEGKQIQGAIRNPIRQVGETDEVFFNRVFEVKNPVISIENIRYEAGNIYGDVTPLPTFPNLGEWSYSMRSIGDVENESGRLVQRTTAILAFDLTDIDVKGHLTNQNKALKNDLENHLAEDGKPVLTDWELKERIAHLEDNMGPDEDIDWLVKARGQLEDLKKLQRFRAMDKNTVNYDLILSELMKSLDLACRFDLPPGNEGFNRLPFNHLIEQRTAVIKTGRATGFTQWAIDKALHDKRVYVILGSPDHQFIRDYDNELNFTKSVFIGDITQYDLIIIDSPLNSDLRGFLSTALTRVQPEELAKSNVRFLIGY